MPLYMHHLLLLCKSENIKNKVIPKFISSPVFALQLDEATYVSNLSQPLAYIRYVADDRNNEELLFCQPLETTSKAADVLQVLIYFFNKNRIELE